jgi:hypothetical protein
MRAFWQLCQADAHCTKCRNNLQSIYEIKAWSVPRVTCEAGRKSKISKGSKAEPQGFMKFESRPSLSSHVITV